MPAPYLRAGGVSTAGAGRAADDSCPPDPGTVSLSRTPRGSMLGPLDPVLEHVVEREALKTALARIPERERRILLLRFFGDMTQSGIAAVSGIRQRHIPDAHLPADREISGPAAHRAHRRRLIPRRSGTDAATKQIRPGPTAPERKSGGLFSGARSRRPGELVRYSGQFRAVPPQEPADVLAVAPHRAAAPRRGRPVRGAPAFPADRA